MRMVRSKTTGLLKPPTELRGNAPLRFREKHFFAKLLGARLRVPVLATGSLLDTEVAHRTHAGRQIEEARRASAAG